MIGNFLIANTDLPKSLSGTLTKCFIKGKHCGENADRMRKEHTRKLQHNTSNSLIGCCILVASISRVQAFTTAIQDVYVIHCL